MTKEAKQNMWVHVVMRIDPLEYAVVAFFFVLGSLWLFYRMIREAVKRGVKYYTS